MRKLILILTMALASTLMGAQTTNVTLNVADGDAQTWNNGGWSVKLVPQPGATGGPFYIMGSTTPVPNQTQSGSLNSSGSTSLVLTPNASIAPSLSIWSFNVCSGTLPIVCSTQLVTISGASQTVNVAPPALRINLVNPTYRYSLYQDVEAVNPTEGAIYWNLISAVFRQYSSGAWGNFTTGGGLSHMIDADGGTISGTVATAVTTNGVYIPITNTDTTTWTNPNFIPILDMRRLGDFRGGRVSVLDFGADDKAGYYQRVSMNSGSSLVTGVYYGDLNNTGGTRTLNSVYVGERFCVSGAGVAGADLCGHVVSYTSGFPATVTLDVSASTTVVGRGGYWGSDSTSAFQAAVNYCSSPNSNISQGCGIDIPRGTYFLSSAVNFPAFSSGTWGYGRTNVQCPAGRGSTRIAWTGADQGVMFYIPLGGNPVEVKGCFFDSTDDYGFVGGYYPAAGRAAIAIQFDGGTQHRFIDNRFGNLYDGIKGTSSWLNLVDHNYFYGPYHAALYWYNGGVAPINSTTVSNNEFGSYGQYGLLSNSAASGGANGNFYFGNDWEGTSTITVADVDANDNWGSFGPNRFETSGSLVGGWQAQILRGTYNNIQITFCGSETTIVGTDNLIACSNLSGAITDNGGYNQYWATNMIRSTNITGTGATSANIMSGNRSGVYMDNGTFKFWAGGATDNARKMPILATASANSSIVAGVMREPTITVSPTNNYTPTAPQAPSGATLQLGDIIYPTDSGYTPNGYRNSTFAWMCVGATGATCVYNGTNWNTGTGWLEYVPFYQKLHGESYNVPTSLTSAQGDWVYKVNPSGTNPLIGWVVTTGGTPGTFAPVYAIDPANTPAWGTTTANTGAFTTLSSSGKATLAGAATGYTTVTFSATPTFDASTTNNFKITLTGNITSSTLVNATAGQILTFAYCQDATGGRTNVYPTNVLGGVPIVATANVCSRQIFRFNGTNAEAISSLMDDNGNVYVNGSYYANSIKGSTLIANGTATLGTAAITSGTCAAAVTVAGTGIATTDAIQYTPNTDPTAVTGYAPSASGSLYIWAYPTAGNVNFKVCNNTSASITPSALTLNWRVAR